MLKKLFGSQIRVDVLNSFLMHPDEEFYIRQLINQLDANPRAVNRELNNLASLGLIKKRISGKQHYFSIDQENAIYHELREIFVKTVGIKDAFEKSLGAFKKDIHFCFIYGSFAKGTYSSQSDIDVMIIGDVRSRKVAGIFSELGEKLGREINFGVFTVDEATKRLNGRDHFFTALLKEPLLFIFGQENELRRLAQE